MDRGGGRHRSRGGGASGRGGGGSATAAASATGKGIFRDGIWYCNCAPRKPAEHFRVKKEGPNKGRWFYTCQQRQPTGGKGCDLFLWDEEAKLREETTVLANSRNEPQQEAQDDWDAGRSEEHVPSKSLPQGRGLFSGINGRQEDSETPSPSPSPAPRPTNASRKRKAWEMTMDEDEDEDEDAQPWSLDGEEEKELAHMTAASSALVTPHKAQKTGVYATPATTVKKSSRTLPWLKEQEPITPTTAKKRTVNDYFTTPSKPTPSRKPITFSETASTSSSSTTTTSTTSSNLTNEILTALAPLQLTPDKLARIRSIATKHDLQTQGVTKGREISRLAVKARDAKIVQLEATVASLEAQRELDRRVIGWRGGGKGEEEEEEESQL